MASFQVVRAKPFAGISKSSQRPYNMLVVNGVFTSDDGEVDTGEMVFMESNSRKLPVTQPGLKYEPIVEIFKNREGKYVSQIVDLKLIKAA